MGITSLIGKLFGADVAPPPDATKLDGTTEAALARSLSALPADERGWITFAEARILFSTKGDQYARSEKRTTTADEKSSRSRRSTGPSSTLSRPRNGPISYAIRP